MRRIVEQPVLWRGSITDLATDIAFLLTPEEGERLRQAIDRLLTFPHLAHKWQGRGHEEVATSPSSLR